MKIAYIYLGEFKEGNGIFTILETQLKWLNKNNIETILYLNENQKNKTTNYKTEIYSLIEFDLSLRRNKIDITIFHGFFFLEYIKIAQKLKSQNIPYLIKPHSSFMKKSWDKGWIKKRIAFYFMGLNKFIRDSNGILFINREEKSNSFNFGKNSFIERNGLDILYKQYEQRKIHDPINISFFSRIDFNHKGIDILLKTIFLLKNKEISFHFWGIGKKKEIDKLEKYILQNDLKNAVYHGGCFGNEKQDVFNEMDILILTSRYEGFPTVIIETLSMGIPAIVTTDTNSCFLQEEGIGWKSNLIATEIADTIILAIEEFKEHNQSINKKCYDYARLNFSIDETIKDSIKIYELVISKSR